jgi:SAM-dependent methyltransferase
MPYFKHSELAKEYHVSLKTVYNWIDAAKQGKLDLELVEQDGRTYIANKQSNVATLRQLAEEGKKYRNTRFHKIITPRPEFYELYSRQQILDIMTSLKTHSEVPRQYNYFAQGAHSWDERMRRDAKQTGLSNALRGTQELLHTNLSAIDHKIEGYNRVNIVDIGPGNGMPVRELLEHLLDKGVLHRYIAIDISEEMLRIAKQNIEEWFGDKVPFEGYVRDIGYERFNDVLVSDMLAKDADETLNLLLFLGGTSTNFRLFSDPLKAIYGSMDANALLVCSNRADTEASRRYFEFSTSRLTSLAGTHTGVIELLNITDDLYSVEMDFDVERRMRYVRIRLNTALTIRFQFEDSVHDVNLEKDSTVMLLRVWHLSPREIMNEYERAGMKLLQSSMTKDRNYLLTIYGMEEAEKETDERTPALRDSTPNPS